MYWLLKKIVLGPILRLVFRPRVEGAEHIPTEGPAILASNHLSFSDSIFLPLVVKRRITFLAKSDYFTGTGIKGRLTAGFFKGVGQLPIDRSGGKAGEAALRSGLRVLAEGNLLGIYPEGTRSPDGHLYRGRTGVARMAVEGRVPVLPVAMIDTDKAQPTGQIIPNIVRIGVRIGPPLDFSRYEGMEDDRFVLRSITDEIMYELMLLSGREYVDVYATSMKKRMLAAAKARARAIQEAASPGRAAPELEEALTAGEEGIRTGRAGLPEPQWLQSITDASEDITADTPRQSEPTPEEAEPGSRAARRRQLRGEGPVSGASGEAGPVTGSPGEADPVGDAPGEAGPVDDVPGEAGAVDDAPTDGSARATG